MWNSVEMNHQLDADAYRLRLPHVRVIAMRVCKPESWITSHACDDSQLAIRI